MRTAHRPRALTRSIGARVAATLASGALAALVGCEHRGERGHGGPAAEPMSILDDRLRVAAAESLQVDRIARVGGFAYSARIDGRVPGLREGGDGRTLRLVEDGLPLGPPGALSADVVALGNGRFNHETAARILFSASDNSDPRRNGRAYGVEWDEPARVVPRAATRTIGIGRTDVVVDVATDRPIASRRLVIENLDRERGVGVWGHATGAPDLTTRDAIIASVVRPGMSDEEKALALWALMTTWRHHDVAAAAGLEAADPVKLLGVYGFGFCNDVAHALASLLERAGLRARIVAWDRHSVVEVRFDDHWHLLDADRGRVYRTQSGQLASVADVFARRARTISSPTGDLPLADENLDFVYPRNANRVYHRALGASEHALRPVLAPGDRLVFDFDRGDRPVDRFSHERPPGWPLRIANGTLRRRLTAEQDGDCRVARLTWPYPIVAAEVSARGLRDDGPLIARVRSDASDTWHDLRVERIATEATARAGVWIERGPIRYGLEVRVCGAAPDELDERADVVLEVVFQFAPRGIPTVSYGANGTRWTVEEVPAARSFGHRFAGVRVTQEWDELDAPSELAVPPGGLLVNLERAFVAPGTRFGYATPLWQHLPAGAGIDPRSNALLVGLFENGHRLGPGDASRDDIAMRGRGRFSLASGQLVFSASDNTDPRTNGRIYSLVVAPRPASSPSPRD